MMGLFRSQGGLGGFQLSALTSSNKPSSPRSAIVSFMIRVRDMQVLEVECSSVGREASMDTLGVMELRARTVLLDASPPSSTSTETSSRVSATTSALVLEEVVVKLALGFHVVEIVVMFWVK